MNLLQDIFFSKNFKNFRNQENMLNELTLSFYFWKVITLKAIVGLLFLKGYYPHKYESRTHTENKVSILCVHKKVEFKGLGELIIIDGRTDEVIWM